MSAGRQTADAAELLVSLKLVREGGRARKLRPAGGSSTSKAPGRKLTVRDGRPRPFELERTTASRSSGTRPERRVWGKVSIPARLPNPADNDFYFVFEPAAGRGPDGWS